MSDKTYQRIVDEQGILNTKFNDLIGSTVNDLLRGWNIKVDDMKNSINVM